VESRKSNNSANTKKREGKKQILIDLRVRRRYWRAGRENKKIANVNTSRHPVKM
jgi:hypothetical protein